MPTRLLETTTHRREAGKAGKAGTLRQVEIIDGSGDHFSIHLAPRHRPDNNELLDSE